MEEQSMLALQELYKNMNQEVNAHNIFYAIYPEIILLVMGCLVALIDLNDKSKSRYKSYSLTLVTLITVAIIQIFNANDKISYSFGSMVVVDSLGSWLKCFASLTMLIALIYAKPYAMARGMLKSGELFSLSIFALLGIFIMISAHNLLLIYLGLELLTLSSYALVALRRDNNQAVEAAMKYFILGSLASGFLLYGMSMIYGATNSLDISIIAEVIREGAVKQQILVFGLVFVVAGLAFKLGAVPFHMWIPDVYHGAPTAITTIIATAPKLAAFVITLRLLSEGLVSLAVDWQQMLLVLAVLSLLVGNLAAIAQTNLKRMLAYSTISHMGFIILGILSAGTSDGNFNYSNAVNAFSASMFYSVTYVLTSLTAFGIIMLLSREGFESEEISDFAGLNKSNPLFALIMMFCLFSIAGIPFFVGFQAKLVILQSLISLGGSLYIGTAIFAVLISCVAAFYYIRVIKIMYFDKPTQEHVITAPLDVQLILTISGFSILLLGIFPNKLLNLCSEALTKSLVINFF